MIRRFQTSLANSDHCRKKGEKTATMIGDQAMDLGQLAFDSSSSDSHFDQRMLLSGGGGGIQTFDVSGTEGGILALTGEEGARKRRASFTSPDELLEEYYYYDEQLPEKKRRLSPEQVRLLERSFEEENKLEPERKSELAQKLGLQPRQVAVWFQNRRARWKTKQLEQDFDCLRSSYNTLLADHDSLLHENDQLRSQVASLTERFHNKAAAAAAAGIGRIKVGDQAASVAHLIPSNAQMKIEDRLSTGGGGSTVLEGGACANQLVDSSEESFFPEGYDCMNPVDGQIPPEEADDASDEGCNYYSDGIFAGKHPQEEEGARMSWWVWN